MFLLLLEAARLRVLGVAVRARAGAWRLRLHEVVERGA
jgi:hypothetical protein